MHVAGAAGHDVVKYAVDTIDDEGDSLSCTHDANAWPADYYAGLPAPRDDEQVILGSRTVYPPRSGWRDRARPDRRQPQGRLR